METQAYNVSTWEAEARGLRVRFHGETPSQQNKSI